MGVFQAFESLINYSWEVTPAFFSKPLIVLETRESTTLWMIGIYVMKK